MNKKTVSHIFIVPILAFLFGIAIYGFFLKELSSPVLIALSLFCFIGLHNLFLGIGNLFYSNKTAEMYGWISNPFQKEYSFINFALATVGVLSFWVRGDFWIATIIIYLPLTVFSLPLLFNGIRKEENLNLKLLFFYNLLISFSTITILVIHLM